MRSLDPSVLEVDGRRAAHGAGRRQGHGRGAVRRAGAEGRPGPHPDDGEAPGRNRRLRGGDPGRVLVLAGSRRRLRTGHDAGAGDARAPRRAWCRASAACTSRPRPPRWSAWAKARATSSSIRTAARSSVRRPPWPSPLAADLGERLRPARTSTPPTRSRRRPLAFAELPAFQCADGGFAFWKGELPHAVPLPHELRAARPAARPGPRLRGRSRGRVQGATPSSRARWPKARRRTTDGGRRTPRGRPSR